MLATRRSLSLLVVAAFAAAACAEKCATDTAGSTSGQVEDWTELMKSDEVEHTVHGQKVCDNNGGELVGLTVTACGMHVAPLVDAKTGEVRRLDEDETIILIHATAYCGRVTTTRLRYVQDKAYQKYGVLRHEGPRPRVTKLFEPSQYASDAYIGYYPYSYEPGSAVERDGDADRAAKYEDSKARTRVPAAFENGNTFI